MKAIRAKRPTTATCRYTLSTSFRAPFSEHASTFASRTARGLTRLVGERERGGGTYRLERTSISPERRPGRCRALRRSVRRGGGRRTSSTGKETRHRAHTLSRRQSSLGAQSPRNFKSSLGRAHGGTTGSDVYNRLERKAGKFCDKRLNTPKFRNSAESPIRPHTRDAGFPQIQTRYMSFQRQFKHTERSPSIIQSKLWSTLPLYTPLNFDA